MLLVEDALPDIQIIDNLTEKETLAVQRRGSRYNDQHLLSPRALPKPGDIVETEMAARAAPHATTIEKPQPKNPYLILVTGRPS